MKYDLRGTAMVMISENAMDRTFLSMLKERGDAIRADHMRTMLGNYQRICEDREGPWAWLQWLAWAIPEPHVLCRDCEHRGGAWCLEARRRGGSVALDAYDVCRGLRSPECPLPFEDKSGEDRWTAIFGRAE